MNCVTQLLQAIEDWSESPDRGNSVDVLYLDSTKSLCTCIVNYILKNSVHISTMHCSSLLTTTALISIQGVYNIYESHLHMHKIILGFM